MGLDMFLGVEIHIISDSKKQELSELLGMPKTADVDVCPMISQSVIEWRKANAIHGWFERNVQGGLESNGVSQPVSIGQLEDLLELCMNVLDHREDREQCKQRLPPVKGFYFGSSEVDDYYFECIEKTLSKVSSWIDWAHVHKEDYSIQFEQSSSW